MSKYSRLLNKAAKLFNEIESTIQPLSDKISEVLEDEQAHVVWQYGDGFVVCYGDAYNARLYVEEIDELFNMSKEEALEFLRERNI